MSRIRKVSVDCALGLGLVLAAQASFTGTGATARETVVYSFCRQSNCTDGALPSGGLIKDRSGNLYGTTAYGGDANCSSPEGCGTVFKLDANSKETVLYAFAGRSDGSAPDGVLAIDNAGNLYGTASSGGFYNRGTIFEVTPGGKEKTVHTFRGERDGADPNAGVILYKGDLYGTTSEGGGGVGCGSQGCGTVFKLTTTGTEKILHIFCSQNACADGLWPYGHLIADDQGNLYGATGAGGTGTGCGNSDGCGTVFRIAPDGTETVLYSFCSQANCADGYNPDAGLIRDNSGNLYGTAYNGGANTYYGAVFKLAPDGTESVLYSFCSQTNCADGSGPVSELVMDKSGNLYGVTASGGANNVGTVFEVKPGGTEKVLYSFPSLVSPNGHLTRDGPNLFGTTFVGGTGSGWCHGCGTVFKIEIR